ncbi:MULTISPECIES: SIR2 family protein [unclassified Bradyrhizobium]|uniref:SIR2 family protein n=1 Tax=unclassified Bradyrhizobium TaxID=2631580 RepID=UPI0028E8224D|nr:MULTISPECIES: SIR2 family protein [unclassified Bradyrhizobium]
MKIKSVQTGGGWVEIDASAAGPNDQDPGLADVRRVMSGAVRAQNLVILAGLGTSLCVTDGTRRLAPTMADLLAHIKEAFNELDSADAKFKGRGGRWSHFLTLSNVQPDNGDLEYILSRAKVASDFLLASQAAEVSDLLAIAEGVIRDKVDFLSSDTDLSKHEAFLRRVARRSARRSRVKLFTTNYDRCFEQAAQRSGFVVVDGFAFASEAIFDSSQFSFDVVRRTSGEEKSDFIENLFHLHKLHGSIDWEFDKKAGQVVKKVGTKAPLLIYPQSTKYEMAFSQPYIEMMGTFQTALRIPNTTLLIAGFGFNDKHIAEPILGAFKGNLALNIVIADPNAESLSAAGGNKYIRAFGELIDNGDGRTALVAARFEDLISVIPDAMAETELERHNERVRRMGASLGK